MVTDEKTASVTHFRPIGKPFLCPLVTDDTVVTIGGL